MGIPLAWFRAVQGAERTSPLLPCLQETRPGFHDLTVGRALTGPALLETAGTATGIGLSAGAEGGGYRIGLGPCAGTVLPAQP